MGESYNLHRCKLYDSQGMWGSLYNLHDPFYLPLHFIEGEIDPETQAPASRLQDIPGSDSGLTFCFFYMCFINN